VPRRGLEGQQRARAGNLELAHVNSEKSSSGNLISLYAARNTLNNENHVSLAIPSSIPLATVSGMPSMNTFPLRRRAPERNADAQFKR
jgi:hypothetical protein